MVLVRNHAHALLAAVYAGGYPAHSYVFKWIRSSRWFRLSSHSRHAMRIMRMHGRDCIGSFQRSSTFKEAHSFWMKTPNWRNDRQKSTGVHHSRFRFICYQPSFPDISIDPVWKFNCLLQLNEFYVLISTMHLRYYDNFLYMRRKRKVTPGTNVLGYECSRSITFT